MAATRIDCDIHPAVGGTRTTLLPYLDDHWKEQVVSRAIDGLDLNSYPPNMPFSGRADWRPAERQAGQRSCDGAARRVRPARREPRDLQRGLRRAGGVRSLHGSRLLQGDQRLDRRRVASKDPRLSASIVVPMQAPDLAVEEIERRAADNRFVSVLVLAQGDLLLGKRHFWPVWQAAEKHKLPGRDPRRQRVPHCAEFDRLAVLSLRILSRRGAGVPGPDPEPGL